jgi:adenosine kinase
MTVAGALEQLEAVIITRGGEGSVIHTRDGSVDIPVVAAEEAKDPTGCGDAYRAGLLYGLANQLDWPTTGRIASLLGAIKIAADGTQNHWFSTEEFRARYRDEFGSEL